MSPEIDFRSAEQSGSWPRPYMQKGRATVLWGRLSAGSSPGQGRPKGRSYLVSRRILIPKENAVREKNLVAEEVAILCGTYRPFRTAGWCVRRSNLALAAEHLPVCTGRVKRGPRYMPRACNRQSSIDNRQSTYPSPCGKCLPYRSAGRCARRSSRAGPGAGWRASASGGSCRCTPAYC
jgi:hypothetical protein